MHRMPAPARHPDAVVYVVDDDASVRRGLARLIDATGFAVETFSSASAFLAHTVGDHAACLVLDIRLPGPSGFDLQAALAASTRPMPIVFITGYGTVPMSVRAMKEGAVDFLQKPFNDKELLAGIERALAQDRVARAARLERAVVQLRFDALTPRERQVLSLVVRGLPNKQIGNELGAAEKTVKIHRGRMMHKMAAGSVAALVVMAQKIDQGPPG